jgi:hypothetical protein
MSTLAYAQLMTTRDDPSKRPPPGLMTYIDIVAALVPAEVLTLHALILSVTTKVKGSDTTITDAQTLSWAFLGLLILSSAFYAAPRLLQKAWKSPDGIRVVIPPLAFIAWTMLQRATAFDAVFPDMAAAPRTVSALFLAVLLGAVAKWLADKKPDAKRSTGTAAP